MRWKIQNSDLFFAKMTAFVVQVLKVRSLDLDFFAELRKKITEGKIDEIQRTIPQPLKYTNFMFNPHILIMTNFSNKEEQIIKAKYVFYGKDQKEPFLEAKVDFFFEQNVVIRRNRFSVFKSTNDCIFNLSKLLEMDLETCRVSLVLPSLNIGIDNTSFPIRQFAKSGKFFFKISSSDVPNSMNFSFLMSPDDPLEEKFHNAHFSLLTREKMFWAITRPIISNNLLSLFFSAENGFTQYTKSFKFLKKQLEIYEFAVCANSFLYKTPLIESIMEGEVPKNDLKFWDDEFEIKLNQFCSTHKTNLQNPSSFRLMILSIVSGLEFCHKSKVFESIVQQFNIKNATKPKQFESALDFKKHIDTFFIDKLFKQKLEVKNYVYLVLKIYINKISSLYSIANEDDNHYYNLLLFPYTIQNMYMTFERDDEINREYFKTKFLELYLLKIYLKIHIPDLYSHILRIGSSIEDLFLYDLLTFFIETFPMNTMLNILNFYTTIEFHHEDKHFMMILFDFYLIESLLKKFKPIFLSCSSNSEILECKKNIFKYQDLSFLSLKTDDLFAKVIGKVISLPRDNNLGLINNPESSGPFSTFQSFADLLTETLETLEMEYSEIDFNYYNLSEVSKLFSQVKSSSRKTEASKKISADKKTFEKDLHGSTDEQTPAIHNILTQSIHINYAQPLSLGNDKTFAIENVDMFYPEKVNVASKSARPVIKMNFERLVSPLFVQSSFFHQSNVKIEASVGNELIIHTIYDVKKKEFLNKDRYFEIDMAGSAMQITFNVTFGQIIFTGNFDIRTFYYNVLEPYSIPLLSKRYGIIFLNVIYLIQTGIDNLPSFFENDISHEYCFDRFLKTEKVYQPPTLVETNSSMQKHYVEYDLLPFLKSSTSSNSTYQYVIKQMNQILSGGVLNFPFIKILMYLIINSVEKRDNSIDLKLDLMWNVLTYYEENEEYITFETAVFVVSSIFINYFPFITPFILNNYAERVFSGYVGRCIKAVLLNENKREIVEITNEMNDMIIQFQIYQNSRFLNFANSDFISLITKIATEKVQNQNFVAFHFIKIEIFVNNCKQVFVIPLKMKYDSNFEYLLKKGKTSHIVNFNNNFLIDKNTFKFLITQDKLLLFLIEEKSNSRKMHHKTQALIKLENRYVECSFANFSSMNQGQNAYLTELQNVYLNKNALNHWMAVKSDLII